VIRQACPCGDAESAAAVKVFKENYETSRATVDSELATTSLYGVDENTAGIPADGSTVLVERMWAMKLFNSQSCQLTTSLRYIRVEA
jgi:hypothetical protein